MKITDLTQTATSLFLALLDSFSRATVMAQASVVCRVVVHRNAKRMKIWANGGVCNMHVGIFDLELVKVIWGHLVHFSENWAVTQKRLVLERNG